MTPTGRTLDLLGAAAQPPGEEIIVDGIEQRSPRERPAPAAQVAPLLFGEHTTDILYRYRLWPERGFEYVSPSATTVTGYTPDEHYADPDLGFKLVHPDDREVLERAAVGADPVPTSITVRWIRKDGKTIWTEQRNVPVIEHGRVVAIEGVARDVTDRVSAEQRLRESERQLAEAQAVAQIGSWHWDVVADVVSWSAQLFTIYGVEEESFDASYEAFLERVHPEDRPMIAAAVERSFQSGDAFSFEHRIVRPDGAIRWVHGRGEVVRDPTGRVVRMFGTGQDITDRKRAYQASARSEYKFRALVSSAPDGVLGVDDAGTIVLANHQVLEMFGYAEEELIGQRLEVLLPERARGVHARHRGAYLADPRPRAMGAGLELSGLRKDGTEFPLDISLSAIETDEGRLVTAFVRDITERKHAEESARQLREAHLARQHALEINDAIVQGLATTVYALESGELDAAVRSARHTLASARQMMGDLLAQTRGEKLAPGDLVRAKPATVHTEAGPQMSRATRAPRPCALRVVIADDTPDIRLLVRLALARDDTFEVVAEVGDGRQAVDAVTRLHPDILVLDLAMPVMDGLQAIPLIRSASPETKIVVLSGYGARQARETVLAAGAVAYVEKGGSMANLVETLHEVTHDTTATRAPAS